MIFTSPMKRAFLALVLFGGCTEMGPQEYSTDTAPIRNGPTEAGVSVSGARDFADLDKVSGRQVSFEGRFDQIGATTGIVTLESGLKIYIPHFDLWARDKAWFQWVGRRVQAGGKLHTNSRTMPDLQGPSIEVNLFQVLE